MRNRRLRLEELWQLVDNVKLQDACYELHYAPDDRGYPQIRIDGKQYRIHRLILSRKLGRKIRPGYETRHLCNNKHCINEKHIEEGTRNENLRDRSKRHRILQRSRGELSPPSLS